MRPVWLIAAVIGLAFAPSAEAAVEYTITDLSAPGQPTRDAWGVNDFGVVVGEMNTGSPYSAYRWTPEAGLRGLAGRNGVALDVNASGVAAGVYDRPEDEFFGTGGRWDVFGDVTPLLPAPDSACAPDADEDCDGSYAHGIGDDGVAVGASTINRGAGSDHAPAYWRLDNAGVRLTDNVGLLEARNASGVMVGQDRPQAAVWFSDTHKVLIPQLTDGQGQTGDSALARDINDAGVVVGDGATRPGGERFRAFSWTQEAGVRRLDTLGFGTTAYAISDRNDIVGVSKVDETPTGSRAVRWRDGVITDLNTLIAPNSGWLLLEAHDVNDQGWIVGGALKDGENRAFLLRPVVPLNVELDAVDSIGDLFDLRLRVSNSGPGQLTPITYRDPSGLVSGAPAVPAERRGAADLIAGPAPAPPGALGTGQSTDSAYRFEATRAGFFPLTAVAQTTTPEGYLVYGRSFLELEFAPRPVSDPLLAALTSGAWVQIEDRLSREYKPGEEKLRKLLNSKLPRWMTRRTPSATESALAASLDLPADALGFSPLNSNPATKPPRGHRDIVKALLKGQYDATRKVLAATLKTGGDGLYKIGEAEVHAFNFWKDQLWDEHALPEQVDMGLELANVARDSYLGLKGKGEDANVFLMQIGRAATDPAARQTAMQDVSTWRDQTIADGLEGLGDSVDAGTKTVNRMEKQFKKIDSDAVSDPEEAAKAAYAFSYGWTEMSSTAAVEVGIQVLGEKGLGLLVGARRMTQAVRTEHTLAEIDELADLRRVPDHPATPAEITARGHTAEDISIIQRIAREESERARLVDGVDITIGIELRDRNPVRKPGLGKPEIVPIKNINEIDLHLGASRAYLGEVGLVDAKLPWYLGLLSKPVQQEIRARHATRVAELKAWESGKMELRKALAKDGHRFEVPLPGGAKKIYDMKITTERHGRTTLIRNKSLRINGRPVGKAGPIVSDTDLRGIVDAVTGRPLPAGIRGKVEQRIYQRLSEELPTFGFHGASFNAFDVPAKYAHKPLKYVLQSLPPGQARLYAKRWSKRLGVNLEELLDLADLGQFVVKVNGREITIGYGAAP